jgi:hypothetical protein
MSVSLCFRKTPKKVKEIDSCGHPIKGIFARKFYGHDGSLNGEKVTLDDEYLDWLYGVRDMLNSNDDVTTINKMISIILAGRTVDIWIG